MSKKFLLVVIVGLLAVVVVVQAQPDEPEQLQVILSPTPARIVIPTTGVQPTVAGQATAIPTFTPTDEGPVQLEARESAGSVNLRAEPDPESDRVGSINPGERYPVTGRYYRWLRVRYEQAPGQTAYVYDELVDIVGDASLIPDITQETLPTADPAIVAATQTWEAVQAIPGGVLTVTASAREIPVPGADSGVVESATGGELTGETGDTGLIPAPQVLPTFTYPPNVVAIAPTAGDAVASPTPEPLVNTGLATSDGVAPIVPIAVLFAVGVIGMLLSFVFR